MDTVAAGFGVEDFSSMLRWAMRAEAEEAAANRKRSRRGWSKKKAKLRWVEGKGRGRAARIEPAGSRSGRQLGPAQGPPVVGSRSGELMLHEAG